MRIQVVSDTHCECGIPIHKQITPQPDVDVCVMAGDFDDATGGANVLNQLGEMFPKVVAVLGNHNFYNGNISNRAKRVREGIENPNVHLLDCDELRLNGVRFLGCVLWSDLNNDDWFVKQACKRINDFYMINDGDARFTPTALMRRHKEEKQWLELMLHEHSVGLPTVVVTHFLPSLLSCDKRYAGQVLNHYFAANCDDLVLDSGVKYWINGHTHTPCDYMIGDTRVVCNPRGYPNENKVYNELILEI